MAIKAESYAVGDTNTRDNESTDNAKYYYELAKAEAGKVIVDSALSSTSAHPVQNKVINSALSSYLPLTGGTMTGNIEFANVESGYRSIGGKVGNNDYWRVGGGATSANNGYLEIATADDGNEPIYVKQYSSGKFVTLKRTATLLDGGGNTSFPGRMSANEVMIGGSVTLSYDSTDKCVNFTFA